jgi:hypothetical protein
LRLDVLVKHMLLAASCIAGQQWQTVIKGK